MATQETKSVANSRIDKGNWITYLKISHFGRLNVDNVCSSTSSTTAIDIGSLCPHGGFPRSVVRSAHCEVKGVVVIVTERRVDFFRKVWMVDGCYWIRHCGNQSILRCDEKTMILSSHEKLFQSRGRVN